MWEAFQHAGWEGLDNLVAIIDVNRLGQTRETMLGWDLDGYVRRIEAFQDHGNVERTLDRDVDGARRVLERFAEAGVDYDDVVETLEREGVEKFAKSFRDLFADLESKRDALVAA